MVMRWFLPVGLGIGLLATHQLWVGRREGLRVGRGREGWLLLFIGWFPLLAWIVNNLMPQY